MQGKAANVSSATQLGFPGQGEGQTMRIERSVDFTIIAARNDE
jgi:hypothetical protein